MKDNKIDFRQTIFPELLSRLSKQELYYTKTYCKPNWVKIEGDVIKVMTKKSRPRYIKIQIEGFQRTWDLLLEHKEVTQARLLEEPDIFRSAFLLIAFDLLDEVEYNEKNNSLRLV